MIRGVPGLAAYKNIFSKKWLKLLLYVLVTVGVFCAILIPRDVRLLKVISGIVRYNAPRLMLLCSVLMVLAMVIRPPSLSNLLTATVIFALFALSLLGLWVYMNTEGNVIVGILPRADAFSFFSDSLLFLEKGYMVGYTHRRPLFSSLFTALIWLGGGNFQIALAALAFLAALVTTLAVLEVRQAFNPLTAIVFFIPQLFYTRSYTGNVMSEMMGYVLGTAAFALILNFIRKNKEDKKKTLWLYGIGVFMYTLAQLSRPGAIATLLFIVLLGGWMFDKEKKIAWRAVAIAVLCAGAAFLVNSVLFRTVSGSPAHQFNNALYGIYGVATGGNGWSQFVLDHPEISSLAPGAREGAMLRILLTQIIQHPMDFIRGNIYQLKIIFSLRPVNTYSIYSFMLSRNSFFNTVTVVAYFMFCALGLAALAIRRKEVISKLIIALLLGFLFSLPISPPYQTQYMRYFAASISFLGILPAFGVAFVFDTLFGKTKFFQFFSRSDSLDNIGILHVGTAGVLLVMTFILPFLPQKKSTLPPRPSCNGEESAMVAPYLPGSTISIIEQDFQSRKWLPFLYETDFFLGIHNIPDGETIQYLDQLETPAEIFPTINLETDQWAYVVLTPGQLADHQAYLTACGEMQNEQFQRSEFGYYYPSQLEFIVK